MRPPRAADGLATGEEPLRLSCLFRTRTRVYPIACRRAKRPPREVAGVLARPTQRSIMRPRETRGDLMILCGEFLPQPEVSLLGDTGYVASPSTGPSRAAHPAAAPGSPPARGAPVHVGLHPVGLLPSEVDRSPALLGRGAEHRSDPVALGAGADRVEHLRLLPQRVDRRPCPESPGLLIAWIPGHAHRRTGP